MDFPRAWEISNAVAVEYHHDKCSTHAGMLCDCDVLFKHPEYLADYASID